jgi:hypothetical protein
MLRGIPIAATVVPLASLLGCAPTTLLTNPVGWPPDWAERSLYTTPNAYIYAGCDAAAGELDRLVAKVARDYAAEVGEPPGRPVIIVGDRGEEPPTDDVEALLIAAVRVSVERESGTQDLADRAEKLRAAVSGVRTAAISTGAKLETLVATMPLTFDQRCLREVVQAPEPITAHGDEALLLPTRACLQENTRRMLDGACKTYQIGPVLRVLAAPVIAVAEARTVDTLAHVREVAVFEHWLFQDPTLSSARKRDIAADYHKRVVGVVEGHVASVVTAAHQTVASTQPSEEQ